MPIHFSPQPAQGYFISRYTGRLTDSEILTAYQAFNESDVWLPSYNELIDLSEADLRLVTTFGIRRIAAYALETMVKHGIQSTKTALYAPHDLPYGLARMYEAFSDESPEQIKVCRDYQEALDWVNQEASFGRPMPE